MKLTGWRTKAWTAYAQLFWGRELSIPTHLTVAEKVLLMCLVRMRCGRIHVEVGSYLGASACFISRGIHAFGMRPEARLYCVDTWLNDAMTEGGRDTYWEFTENVRRFATSITPLRQRSEQAAVFFAEAVDFLFVDGDHSYEGVASDIRAWFPKLAPEAVVVFHDYGWAEGVQRAVTELVRPLEKRPGTVVDNTYWTVV